MKGSWGGCTLESQHKSIAHHFSLRHPALVLWRREGLRKLSTWYCWGNQLLRYRSCILQFMCSQWTCHTLIISAPCFRWLWVVLHSCSSWLWVVLVLTRRRHQHLQKFIFQLNLFRAQTWSSLFVWLLARVWDPSWLPLTSRKISGLSSPYVWAPKLSLVKCSKLRARKKSV